VKHVDNNESLIKAINEMTGNVVKSFCKVVNGLDGKVYFDKKIEIMKEEYP